MLFARWVPRKTVYCWCPPPSRSWSGRLDIMRKSMPTPRLANTRSNSKKRFWIFDYPCIQLNGNLMLHLLGLLRFRMRGISSRYSVTLQVLSLKGWLASTMSRSWFSTHPFPEYGPTYVAKPSYRARALLFDDVLYTGVFRCEACCRAHENDVGPQTAIGRRRKPCDCIYHVHSVEQDRIIGTNWCR